jgi:hypothetical protein
MCAELTSWQLDFNSTRTAAKLTVVHWHAQRAYRHKLLFSEDLSGSRYPSVDLEAIGHSIVIRQLTRHGH